MCANVLSGSAALPVLASPPAARYPLSGAFGEHRDSPRPAESESSDDLSDFIVDGSSEASDDSVPSESSASTAPFSHAAFDLAREVHAEVARQRNPAGELAILAGIRSAAPAPLGSVSWSREAYVRFLTAVVQWPEAAAVLRDDARAGPDQSVYHDVVRAVEGELTSVRDSLALSSAWGREIRLQIMASVSAHANLQTRPVVEIRAREAVSIDCEACHRKNHPAR